MIEKAPKNFKNQPRPSSGLDLSIQVNKKPKSFTHDRPILHTWFWGTLDLREMVPQPDDF
jgi:hypothetical protein